MSNSRLEQLLGFLNENPSDSFLLFAVAKEYETHNQLDKALEYYLDLKEKDADYIGLYYHLAKLYEVLAEDMRAMEVYDEGIDLAKSQGDFHALSELNNARTNLSIQLGN